ncbi:MAG: SsrA-binding protein SmpB [Lachnospiraceae bacterium]|nr:SsrA-binding protein SmpB [Lachnospiraceae bacterium]
MAKETGTKLVANNKKAYHEYFIEETLEAGMELVGTEVKSLRLGKCSIKESWIGVDKGEMFIYGMHISPYEMGNIFNRDPLRVRKLLLHKREIMKFSQKVREAGYTIMPLEVYFSKGRAKLKIGLAKGKKLYDKREAQAKKDMKREVEREYKLKF